MKTHNITMPVAQLTHFIGQLILWEDRGESPYSIAGIIGIVLSRVLYSTPSYNYRMPNKLFSTQICLHHSTIFSSSAEKLDSHTSSMDNKFDT